MRARWLTGVVLAWLSFAAGAGAGAGAGDEPPGVGAPAAVVELGGDVGSGVRSAVLGNGLVVHHRRMDAERIDATVVILGGPAQEDATSRGLSLAAAGVFNRSARARMERAVEAGERLEMWAVPTDEAVVVTLRGDAAGIGRGLSHLHGWLSRPAVETTDLKSWKSEQTGLIRARSGDSRLAAEGLRRRWLHHDDPRQWLLEREELDAIEGSQVRRWIGVLASRPIESAVVGPIGLEGAVGLVQERLGRLPIRARPEPGVMDEFRAPRPEKPVRPLVLLSLPTLEDDSTTAMCCFVGPGLSEIQSLRALTLGMSVLERRLQERFVGTGAWGAHQAFAAVVSAGRADRSDVVVGTECERSGGRAVSAGMFRAIQELKSEELSEEELDAVRAEVVARVTLELGKTGRWSRLLATRSLSGQDPGAIGLAAEGYASITPAQVQQAVATYLDPRLRVNVVVAPVDPALLEGE